MENEFKIGDYVSVGTDKQKGRIVNEFKPFGTFNMYTVHLFNNGTMVTAAKHELVKGMEDNEFNKMLPTTSNIDLSSLISNNSNINLSTTTAVPQPLVPATITDPPPPPQQCNTSESITDNQLSNCTFENDLDANTIEALFNEIFNKTQQKSEMFKQFLMMILIISFSRMKMKIQGVKHCHISNYFANFFPKKVNLEKLKTYLPWNLIIICKFAVSVRQKYGNEYAPSYLRGMFGSFERYLRRHRIAMTVLLKVMNSVAQKKCCSASKKI